MGLEAQWRPRGNVIPASAGIQEPGGRLDSRVRGNDVEKGTGKLEQNPWMPAYVGMTITLCYRMSALQCA